MNKIDVSFIVSMVIVIVTGFWVVYIGWITANSIPEDADIGILNYFPLFLIGCAVVSLLLAKRVEKKDNKL